MSDPGLHLGWKRWKTRRHGRSRPIQLCGDASREGDSPRRFKGKLLECRMELDGRCAAFRLLLFAFVVGFARSGIDLRSVLEKLINPR